MNINRISSAIQSGASTVLGGFSKSNPMDALKNAFNKDPASATALMVVSSIIIKDGVGCYKYVTQSLNNDKIPEKKRKFVAALDLTNGVLMIIAQIGMFFAMKKLSGPFFNKLYKNTFSDKSIKYLIERARMLQSKLGLTVERKMVVQKEVDAVKQAALDSFRFVADIAAATILGKRVIVPLIATPLASKVQARMDKHPSDTGKNENVNDASNSVNTDKKASDNKLDITNTEDTNLLNRYKKYYGPIQK